MIFRFKHQSQIYVFDDEIMSIEEARWIERETGYVGDEWIRAFRKMGVNAVLAIFCLALKRGGIEIDKLDDAPLDPSNGYMQLVQSILVDEQDAPAPPTSGPVVKTVRKKAVVKR